jgi:CO/xanthine dehydrogenase FAD-binding subunit
MVSAFRPSTLGEALSLLGGAKGERRLVPLAGGTDLMVKWRRAWGRAAGIEPAFPCPVVFVGHLRELGGVSVEGASRNAGKDAGTARGSRMLIGAACTFSFLLAHPAVPAPFKEILSQIASPAIRNRGTIGGNVCNASPAGDAIPYLYALDAAAILRGSGGVRVLPVTALITGPGATARAHDELLVSLEVPLAPFNVFFYRKIGARRSNSCSKLSFLGLARVEGGVVADVRVCFGAVGPTVVRSPEIEESLKGKDVREVFERVPRIARSYGALLKPIEDKRSAASYRMEVSLRLLERFLGFELQGGEAQPPGAAPRRDTARGTSDEERP